MRLSRIRRIAFASLTVAAVAVGIAIFILSAKGRSALDEQLRLARREGIATTLADLAPDPPVAAADNAAVFYRQAIAKAKPSNLAALRRLMDRRPAFDLHNPVHRAAFETLYAQLKPSIDDIIEGGKCSRCDFQYDLSTFGVGPVLATVSDFWPLMWASSTEANLLSMEGKPIEGLDLTRSIAPAGTHFVEYRFPLAFSFLAVNVSQRVVTEFIGETLMNHGRERGIPEAASAALSALGPDTDVVKAIVGANLSTLSRLRPSGITEMIAENRFPGMHGKDAAEMSRDSILPGVVDRWKTIEFQTTRKLVAAARADGDDWVRLAADLKSIETGASAPTDISHVFARIHHGGHGQRDLAALLAPVLSRRRVMTQAAAIFEAWNRTGKLPDFLPLKGLPAHDPLGNAPLRYSHTATGFTVSAVGPDKVWRRTLPISKPELEIVFTYPAKPNLQPIPPPKPT